jgi:hypothetical protein
VVPNFDNEVGRKWDIEPSWGFFATFGLGDDQHDKESEE